MKRSASLLVIVLALIFFTKCTDYKPEANGVLGDVLVIMDSTRWDSQTAEAIRATFGRMIPTLTDAQPFMDLRFRNIESNDQLERLKQHKNIIIAAPITDTTNVAQFIKALLGEQVEQSIKEGENFSFPIEDEWYRNQWVMILTSTSDSLLAQKIMNAGETLTHSLFQKEMRRWIYEIYRRAEQKAIEDSLWANHGWKIRIQHDWQPSIDTTYTENGDVNHLVTMRRPLPKNDRWFWAWWSSDIPPIDSLSPEWINTKRDSIMRQWIRGTRDSSYVTTEYRRPVLTDTLTIDGHPAFETLGTWRMTHDAMGGTFANMTIYDKQQGRLFILEFGNFAPTLDKRGFVREFRAMLRTFKSDSTWNGANDE